MSLIAQGGHTRVMDQIMVLFSLVKTATKLLILHFILFATDFEGLFHGSNPWFSSEIKSRIASIGGNKILQTCGQKGVNLVLDRKQAGFRLTDTSCAQIVRA